MAGSAEGALRRLLGLQPLWLAGVAGAWCAVLLFLPLDPDYTAGELLDHLLAWRGGEPLYPALADGPPWRVLNYPPLYLAGSRLLAALGLPALAAGRLLNDAGLVVLVAGVATWLRDDGLGRREAWGVAALLAASFPALYGAGQVHLEPWAVALTVQGGLRLRRDGAGAAATGGLLLAAACFVKHTQVVPSVALLAWALSRRRRRGGLAAATAWVGAGAAGSALLTVAFGWEAWRHLLAYTVGTYGAAQLGEQLLSHALPFAGFAAVAAAAGTGGGAVRRGPAWWYFVAAWLWTLSSARLGGGYAYFLDAHVATLLVVGAGLAEAWAPAEAPGPPRSPGAGMPRWGPAVLVAWALPANLAVAGVLGWNLAATRARAAALPEVCPAVRAAATPVPVGSPGEARACGGRAALHPFILSSLASRGLWDEGPFVEALRAGRYPVALLPFDPAQGADGVDAQRWTPAMVGAFAEGYRADPVGAGFLLRPR